MNPWIHNYDSDRLRITLTTNFRLFQTERASDANFKFDENERVFQTGRKRCGKRGNCSLRAISPFPTVSSKDLYYRHVKTRDCFASVRSSYVEIPSQIKYFQRCL